MLLTHRPSGRPRHRTKSAHSPLILAVRWFLTFRWHLLALFLSDLGRSMIVRKYDAFTTDNGYEAAGRGGNVLTRFVDRIVRRRDTHVALRQRLDIVSSELVEVALAARERGPVRLISGPVGLGRDLRQAWSRLESLGTHPASWLEVVGIDLDHSGTVLDEASRLAAADHVPLETFRVDLLDPEGVAGIAGRSVNIFNSIGLGVWLDARGVESLLESVCSVLKPGGVLMIDHWRRHGGSRYVGALQMPARYVTDTEFEASLETAGFTVEQKRSTPNDIVVVYRARLGVNRSESGSTVTT